MITRNVFWMGINNFHEAAKERFFGKVAVGHVVLTRAVERSETAEEVILSPKQFSWHNGDRYPAIPAGRDSYERLFECFLAAQEAVDQRVEGKNLFGANHYFNPELVSPDWAEVMEKVASIGNHDFYRSGL